MPYAGRIIAGMVDDDATDHELLRRYAAGDASAFERLYDRHERRVWRYLTRGLGDRAVAEEVLQDVWFAVAREAANYQPTARFTTWLYTLAHHRLVDVVRARRPMVSLDDAASAADLGGRLAADAGQEPPAWAERALEAARIGRALAAIPEDQRTALLLHVEADLSLEEVAAVTGTIPKTVKSRLRYARAKLRTLLAEVP